MIWKQKNINTDSEKDIITGLIVSDRFIKEIVPLIYPDSFQINFSRIVSKWCINYFKKYDKAPQSTIQQLFESEKDDLDEEVANSIESFLSNLSKRYDEKFNADYAIDKAELYLKQRKLEQLKADITADLTKNKITEAESRVAEFKRVERFSGQGIDILEDKEAIINAFHEEDDELFCLPGDLGRMIKPFNRGDLIAFAAPAKRGKTWWLQEVGIKALFSKYKVAFFSLEMQQNQMVRRFYQSLLGETRKPLAMGETIDLHYFDDENNIRGKEIVKTGLSASKAIRKNNAFKKMIKTGSFKLICFPAHSVTVEGLEMHLDNMEHYDQFIPDIIIVDYADILASGLKGDYRHQIDQIWKTLRGMAQRRHCLVVTATHTNRATFNRNTEQADISEDIRKINHVAVMIALNQEREDKQRGVMRASLLASRHESFDQDEVIILHNFNIGKPYLDSRFKRSVKNL